MFLKSSTKTSPHSFNGQRINKMKRQSRPSNLQNLNDSNASSKASGNASAMSSPGKGSSSPTSSPFSGCPLCVIHDNDPRVSYVGPWTLTGPQLSTAHSTTSTGASISLHFNGEPEEIVMMTMLKYTPYPLRVRYSCVWHSSVEQRHRPTTNGGVFS